MSKKTNKGHDYSTILIWSAALVTVVRYAAAFIASDMGEILGTLSEVISFAMGFTGLGMGILDVIGGAYLFDGWRRTMPKSGGGWPFRFKVLTAFVFGLILTGIGILVPFTVSRVLQTTIAHVLGTGWGLWMWSAAVNVAPYLLIGGVSTSTSVVTVSSTEAVNLGGNFPKDEGKVSGNFPKDWRKARPFMSEAEVGEIAKMPTKAIQDKYHLESDKSARNWRKYAAAEIAARVVEQA